MRSGKLTLRRLSFLALGLPVVAALSWIGVVFIEHDNFRTTSAELYRSGQLRSEQWRESFDAAHYRSVLNLRGSKPKSDWYQREIEFASDHGLEHHDYELWAHVAPSLTQMKELVQLMRQAPKPMLIHCKNGSDRSGLVAALYVFAVEGRSADEARKQLSLWYGHFPWLGSQSGAMDAALEQYLASVSAEAATTDSRPAKSL